MDLWNSVAARLPLSKSSSEDEASNTTKAETILIANMDRQFLPLYQEPQSRGSGSNKRLLFIGDIHGCMDELQHLLHKAKYNAETDHIIAVGDMVNKGPKSLEVIEFLRSHNASCVRGNHEQKIFKALKKPHKHKSSEPKLAASLSAKQLEYLHSCPIILQVGEVKPHGNIVVVHGGLVPGLDLRAQEPSSVMNMRLINPKTREPSKEHHLYGYDHWANVWNDYQKSLIDESEGENIESLHMPLVTHTTVVYGHDAKRGLQIHKWTKGLDSGCVKGGKLTMWIVDSKGRDEIIQVQGRDYVDAAE